MIRISAEEASRIHLLLETCRQQGRDPVAALDAAGWLMYDAAKVQLRRDLIHNLADLLGVLSLDAIAKQLEIAPVPHTARDIKAMFVTWLDVLADETQQPTQ